MTVIDPALAPDGQMLEGEALARRVVQRLGLRPWRGNSRPHWDGGCLRVWCTGGRPGHGGELVLVDERSLAWVAMLEDILGLEGPQLVAATAAVRELAQAPEYAHISEWLGRRDHEADQGT